jgi:hypothetical protein
MFFIDTRSVAIAVIHTYNLKIVKMNVSTVQIRLVKILMALVIVMAGKHAEWE